MTMSIQYKLGALTRTTLVTLTITLILIVQLNLNDTSYNTYNYDEKYITL